MKKIIVFTIFIFLFLLGFWRVFLVQNQSDKIKWKTENAVIITEKAPIPIRLEVADTPEKQKIGLMYRKNMNFENGMIFLFSQPRKATMWMKNTLIPLDMIFFDHQFVIRHIHLNAQPHDETIIRTPMPINGVIEVNAGFVRQNHVSVGDKLVYPVQLNNQKDHLQ